MNSGYCLLPPYWDMGFQSRHLKGMALAPHVVAVDAGSYRPWPLFILAREYPLLDRAAVKQ